MREVEASLRVPDVEASLRVSEVEVSMRVPEVEAYMRVPEVEAYKIRFIMQVLYSNGLIIHQDCNFTGLQYFAQFPPHKMQKYSNTPLEGTVNSIEQRVEPFVKLMVKNSIPFHSTEAGAAPRLVNTTEATQDLLSTQKLPQKVSVGKRSLYCRLCT